ncbi:MAG: diaminopimelate epimerase [Rhodothermaceae bacterium]|nr:diaminopimelate epimerase [Rhodothermaceae bacterium]
MLNPRALVVPFTKMNGAGNDFIVLDNRFLHFNDAELSGLARRFCPRRTGVGADGILALNPPETDGAHFRMRYFNADGSLGTMCGNGARCLARFARMAGIKGDPLVFDTDGGRYTADTPAEPTAPVRLHVPSPRAFTTVTLAEAQVEGETFGIWTGTEHTVRFVDDVQNAPLADEGPAIRCDSALAPAGANVNFVEVVEDGEQARVRARTYEKGVEGETLACGTGALASALVARLAGRIGADQVAIEMPGGTLTVGFSLPNGETSAEAVRTLTLEGSAETVYQGTLET